MTPETFWLDANDRSGLFVNQWPLRYAQGDRWPIQPAISASSGETVRHLALQGQGIACLSHFMTHEDIASGRLPWAGVRGRRCWRRYGAH